MSGPSRRRHRAPPPSRRLYLMVSQKPSESSCQSIARCPSSPNLHISPRRLWRRRRLLRHYHRRRCRQRRLRRRRRRLHRRCSRHRRCRHRRCRVRRHRHRRRPRRPRHRRRLRGHLRSRRRRRPPSHHRQRSAGTNSSTNTSARGSRVSGGTSILSSVPLPCSRAAAAAGSVTCAPCCAGSHRDGWTDPPHPT